MNGIWGGGKRCCCFFFRGLTFLGIHSIWLQLYTFSKQQLSDRGLDRIPRARFCGDLYTSHSFSSLQAACVEVEWEKVDHTTGVMFDFANPNNALLQGKSYTLAIHLHCLIPPKMGNWMIPVRWYHNHPEINDWRHGVLRLLFSGPESQQNPEKMKRLRKRTREM